VRPREKTHCLRGHLLAGSGAQIGRYPKGRWLRRVCLQCERARNKQRRIRSILAKRKAA
jgi:hypothetical protein